MRLKAGCDIHLSAPSPASLVAMLRPRSGTAQWIIGERYDFEPFVQATEYVDAFGNLCQRLTAPAGAFRIRTEVEIEVAEAIAVEPSAGPANVEDLPDYVLQFLLPSRYCQSDMLESVAEDVVAGRKPGYEQVDAIREFIREQIEYRSGASNGSTSAVDTLRDRAGVCRDFSHVGLSLCRALRIPARMVVGYLLGLTPMDLHAWFEAFVGGRWYTFDATQPKPRGGRIAIAYGRDAADVALLTELGPLKTERMNVWVHEVSAGDVKGVNLPA
ncbi:MAG: transglutaminase domain protein [Polyangiaceae bacterium]|jgi:transglutaminase-like putative cysteine protease|nr:transglutaminase domain protein [Polyangiaceae bacterium]